MKIVRALRLIAAIGYIARPAFTAWLFLFSRNAAVLSNVYMTWDQADTLGKVGWVLLATQTALIVAVVMTSFFPSSKALRLAFITELGFGICVWIFRAFTEVHLPLDAIDQYIGIRALMGMTLWFESNIKTYGHIWGKHQPKK